MDFTTKTKEEVFKLGQRSGAILAITALHELMVETGGSVDINTWIDTAKKVLTDNGLAEDDEF